MRCVLLEGDYMKGTEGVITVACYSGQLLQLHFFLLILSALSCQGFSPWQEIQIWHHDNQKYHLKRSSANVTCKLLKTK